MGFCGSADPETAKQQQRNKKVQQDLAQARMKKGGTARLLLLGTGESGKSTIFKQMKIIHKDGYDPAECMKHKDVIYGNILQSIRILIDAMSKLSIAWGSENAKLVAQDIMEIPEQRITMDPLSILNESLGKQIKHVWQDAGIKQAYERRSEYQLNDSTNYYMDDIDRIAASNYQPTRQDVLRSRVKTVGIVEADFVIDGHNFKIIDVGGQRNERRKWIHVFDEVTAIIFVTSLSEFDQKLVEDHTMNRMKESLLLFDEICNCRYFRNTSIIIFFNKKDLFEEKIKKVDLNVCFPEYTGGKDYEAATKFIQNNYMALDKNKKKTRQLYPHFTCATDTEAVRVVFNAVKNITLQELMRRHQLV